MTNQILIKCPDCGKERLVRLSNTRRNNFTGICYSCFFKYHNPLVGKSGLAGKSRNILPRLHEGYVTIHKPEHHRANKNGNVKRCVLVLEKKLGRELDKTEHVHHINGIRDDDRPENLMPLTNSEHTRLHAIERHKTQKVFN